MEDILEDSSLNFDMENDFESSELDFMDSGEKKDVEKTVRSLKSAVKFPKEYAGEKEDKSKNRIYIAIILACCILIGCMGYGAYGFYQKKVEQMEIEKVIKIRPQEAETCIGSLAIRAFPTPSGDESFMKAPVKIIAVKDNMINYVDANGVSRILKKEFCDDNWMKWDDYQKLKNLGKNIEKKVE
ncbi:hypothetical protein SAMN02745945_00187 [Peptoclostridium litorale DSM 5388]|uniref:Uncharacterized protein n=1 Tax=Peptoclostridium litorale DSM 5388 TaxID=1121324 RepID=A0A069RHU8_PEPLI|nr:hypothetical protein [Peptoclostridium litorale]KDR96566.1 hypothetical protein CLIT_2c01720 [Peptoclostridium litorale DSM 5388]SIN69051.1 hypothetical protein SAMN02745945_00187 [Peptoclostridium litorale DSM 5388]